MNGRRSNPGDPTAERTADQSTQTAGGLGGGARVPEERETGDLLNRNEDERYTTPRKYEEGDDPALGSDEPTLRTEI